MKETIEIEQEMLEMLKKAYVFIDESGEQGGVNEFLKEIEIVIHKATTK